MSESGKASGEIRSASKCTQSLLHNSLQIIVIPICPNSAGELPDGFIGLYLAFVMIPVPLPGFDLPDIYCFNSSRFFSLYSKVTFSAFFLRIVLSLLFSFFVQGHFLVLGKNSCQSRFH